MFKKLFNYFWGWELMYSTHRIDDYARVKGKLANAGVKHRTKCINHGNRSGGFGEYTTYEVWVSKDEMHKAYRAIH